MSGAGEALTILPMQLQVGEAHSYPRSEAAWSPGAESRELEEEDHMATHKVVKHDEWLRARKRHLAKEKELTRMRDQLSRERRELPWELVEKEYTFEGESGKMSLRDVFYGRSQLVVYHAMFNPETAGPETTWTVDAACFACSFWLDNFNGVTVHLNHRDITIVAVSLAQYP